MPRATVFAVPPLSWMLKVRRLAPSASPSWATRPWIWLVSHPRPTTSTAAKFACRA